MKKRILTLVLMMCMVFTFVACGDNNTTNGDNDNVNNEQNENEDEADNNENEENNSDEAEDGKVTYTVTVTDEDGNPISGAMVQVCDAGNCYAPAKTDENGVVTFSLTESDEYKTKLLANPEGYEAVETDYVYFEGETEVTLTVKAVE